MRAGGGWLEKLLLGLAALASAASFYLTPFWGLWEELELEQLGQ